MTEKAAKPHVKLSEKVIKLSQVVTAGTVIIGAITGLYVWLDNRFISRVSDQIEEVRTEMVESDEKTDRQLTRLELITLMHDQPNNTAEVEKVAKHYFVDLGGDWYVSGLYSEWAQEHGGDATFMTKDEG